MDELSIFLGGSYIIHTYIYIYILGGDTHTTTNQFPSDYLT
jgi:hypothetical protein